MSLEGEHRVQAVDGVASFVLPGGVSTVHIDGFADPVTVTNHKGDLTIDVESFDAWSGYTVVIGGDHRVVVMDHRHLDVVE